MTIDGNSLVNGAYASARALSSRPTTAESEATLTKFAQDFTDMVRNNEKKIALNLVSGADPQALVQAITETELAIETTVAVRNKVVEAYQEILRMPV
ncbi:MAG: flagellar hook-basal body complex protein FliE [Pseudomonadota bacterium]